MRTVARPFAALALTILGACGSITDPTSPSAMAAIQLRTPKPPILFVHGWNSNASIWTTMIGRFQTDGWQSGELASFSYNSSLSNATTAATIAQKVAALQQANGGAKVTIIGHSMGTLSARYYVRNLGGTATVSTIISLAGTNHGTNTAIFCFQTACREMVPGSTFLTALNADDETWGSPRYRAWWSPCDEVINPRQSAQILTADNTQTACLKHSQLYQDATVYAQVRDFVNSAPVNVNVLAN
ncbi:MAG TPA: alpha/beta fold hydrolase [Gemmatimonadaceae bacterium]|nr:alpha/beta fold hydrolase [Gemmatimonadaceae bacterium]